MRDKPLVECARESDVLDALASARWPSRVERELADHVASCAICQDVVTVATAIQADHDEADDEAEYPQCCITATNDKGPAAKQGEGQNGARFVAEVGPHFTQGRECRDARDASFVSPESSGGSKIYPVQIYSRGCNHGADYPFDFSTIGSRRRRTGFCDLHRAILRTSLSQRKPVLSLI